MTISLLSWEDAVRWYRDQPGNEAEVRDNYFDLPVLQAAERYAKSEEFAEVLRLLGAGENRRILEPGAGNGIASFALARSGWVVTALEPDESAEVGAGAIREIVEQTGLPINVVQEFGELLPFEDESFDAIHARQVLHHASDHCRDLAETCGPARRPRTVPSRSYDAEMEPTLAIAVNCRLTAGGMIAAAPPLRCGGRQTLPDWHTVGRNKFPCSPAVTNA